MPRARMDEARQEEILSALEACILDRGLLQTSLNDVAEKAGLARPLVRHFVGNRDEMIERLFERLIDRGEKQLEALNSAERSPSLNERLDLLYGDLFSNRASNVVVSELWAHARRNERTRPRLRALYEKVLGSLVDAMKREGLGHTRTQRHDAAYALVSLAYGHAAFREIELQPKTKRSPRAMADIIVSTLADKG